MSGFNRVMYVGLSVRDAARSSEWYQRVLGLAVVRENFNSSSRPSDWNEVLLRDGVSGLLIGLLQHPSNPGDEFSEFRTGLDHLEFEVSTRGELEEWLRRLDEHGVIHSEIKDEHILTFRDPDNIQLEFFLPTSGAVTSESRSTHKEPNPRI